MRAFDIPPLLAQQQASGQLYLEFLRVPEMSLGVYELKVGATDPQGPHREGEAYYVLSGRSQFRVGDEERAVQVGDILYVPAHAEHRFHTITEDLRLLVFFAPAET